MPGMPKACLLYTSKINELGFIETPYRKVAEGKVDLSDEGLVYLTAEEEEAKIIAQGNACLLYTSREVISLVTFWWRLLWWVRLLII